MVGWSTTIRFAQPALVNPELRQVIPLAPEFIRMQDGARKQDCETNAGKRAVVRIRAEHPQLPAIIVGDAPVLHQPLCPTSAGAALLLFPGSQTW